MLDALRALLARGRPSDYPVAAAPSTPGVDDVQLAAAALLLELSHADGEFSPQERVYLAGALARHFNLEPEVVTDLLGVAEAERQVSIDHFQFTRVIRERLDIGQRTLLAEVMWGVVLADGRVGDHEGYLMRKLGHLLDLAPGYLADARRRAAGPPG
jgi:uncharacterized tellurite resistance protein B-like protein